MVGVCYWFFWLCVVLVFGVGCCCGVFVCFRCCCKMFGMFCCGGLILVYW